MNEQEAIKLKFENEQLLRRNMALEHDNRLMKNCLRNVLKNCISSAIRQRVENTIKKLIY